MLKLPETFINYQYKGKHVFSLKAERSLVQLIFTSPWQQTSHQTPPLWCPGWPGSCTCCPKVTQISHLIRPLAGVLVKINNKILVFLSPCSKWRHHPEVKAACCEDRRVLAEMLGHSQTNTPSLCWTCSLLPESYSTSVDHPVVTYPEWGSWTHLKLFSWCLWWIP